MLKEITIDMVRTLFKERFASLSKNDRNSFKQRFIVHDYEVFPDAVLLTAIDLSDGTVVSIWGPEAIRHYIQRSFLNDPHAVLVGFNNKGYDNRITDAILAGDNAEQIGKLSRSLVDNEDSIKDENGFTPWYSGKEGRRPFWLGRTFDIGFDIGQRKIGNPPNERKIPEVSLKRWERLNGYQQVRCPISFMRTKLTAEEQRIVEKYCLYDVCATAMLLLSDEAWNPCLNARRVLVDDYAGKGVNWEITKPRITSLVLNASTKNFSPFEDDDDIHAWMKQHYVVPSCIRIWKNRDVLKAYTEHTVGELREMSSKASGGTGVLSKNICGIPHMYGIGGVHGCIDGLWKCYDGGIYSLDAASLYPNIMRHFNFLSRTIIGKDRDKFGELIDLRTHVYKPKGDKRADGLKLVLNGGFGSMGFEQSDMYDPFYFCCVTITGQLLITDLLEKLENYIELIQSNTDGIFFRFKPNRSLEDAKAIVTAFEKRTKLEMEWSEFSAMYQKDVSNYIAQSTKGKLKKKGTFYSIKHCTCVPYLYEARAYAALHDGAILPPAGFDIDRFSIELKRDKNSECFCVNGEPDYREWIEVVPVSPASPHEAKVDVIVKKNEEQAVPQSSLFGEDASIVFGKHRKATGCPAHVALASAVSVADIDLRWYASDIKKAAAKKSDKTSSDFDCELL